MWRTKAKTTDGRRSAKSTLKRFAEHEKGHLVRIWIRASASHQTAVQRFARESGSSRLAVDDATVDAEQKAEAGGL